MVTRNKRYSILLASICIESTNWNFGTHEKVAIPIPIVTCTLPIPIPIFGILVFPFPWDSHGNSMGMGIPFPCTSLPPDVSISPRYVPIGSTRFSRWQFRPCIIRISANLQAIHPSRGSQARLSAAAAIIDHPDATCYNGDDHHRMAA